MPEVAGPIGRVVAVGAESLVIGAGEGSPNARLVLDRVSGFGAANRKAVDAAKRHWLADRLRRGDPSLRKALLERRRAAMAKLGKCAAVVEVRLTVADAPLVIGHSGAGSANDTSLALHRISGDPVLPATALKGVTRALVGDDRHMFGSGENPATGEKARMGAVTFMPGLALTDRMSVRVAVLTPHAQSYYDDPAQPPSGQDPPVPIEFLAVCSGSFLTHLVGADADAVKEAAYRLVESADEIGLGAKTSTGFGYLKGQLP